MLPIFFPCIKLETICIYPRQVPFAFDPQPFLVPDVHNFCENLGPKMSENFEVHLLLGLESGFL